MPSNQPPAFDVSEQIRKNAIKQKDNWPILEFKTGARLPNLDIRRSCKFHEFRPIDT